MSNRDGTLQPRVARKSVLLAGLAVAGLAAAANAEIIGPGLTISATNASGSASFHVDLNDPFAETFPDGSWRYVLPSPVVLQNGSGDVIGTINDLRGDVFTNPHVLIVFDVTAGMSDTSFTISSALETVSPIPSSVAMGGGTAGMTYADSDGAGGVTVTGNYPGGDMYRMLINGAGPGDGTVLGSLISGPLTAPSGTSSTSANSGGIAAGTAISSFTSQFSFTVTGGDTATGNSSFTVIPTPGAAALMGLGVFAFGFRRKR